ncbi:WXG100 family type VII secretion target [Actinomyces oricola]|uniref:WXG100 family type VII secretion target n=1 Tax=Actinomyces oricola TaxID=206043 RepID=UPI001F500EB7|nr:WXG100 family type VII secretion target [Actinomyces oricola]
MTMANISASYDEMNQQAASLRSTRDNIQQMLQQARMQVDNLVSSGFVTDSASGAFQANYQEFTTSATKTIDSSGARQSCFYGAVTRRVASDGS